MPTHGRERGKELDPRVAGELETPQSSGRPDPARQAGHGAGQTPEQTRGSAQPEAQPNPRTSPEESSAASYEERAEPRDDAVEDGG